MYAAERQAILKANPWLPEWKEHWVTETGFKGAGAYGWARAGRLTVCPSICTKPGQGYSWPGSVSDRTARGVYLHEVGHVVHAALNNEEEALEELRALSGPKVTGYEPNAKETFAETFRLYAGNPALLEAGRPWRFEFLYGLGVRPPAGTSKTWEGGLIGRAPIRYYDQCERWISRGIDFLERRRVSKLGKL